jgi:hypothetical protein
MSEGRKRTPTVMLALKGLELDVGEVRTCRRATSRPLQSEPGRIYWVGRETMIRPTRDQTALGVIHNPMYFEENFG